MSHLLDPAALAARWMYTPRAIYDWLQHHPERLPPCLRLGSGRTVRFRLEDVEAFERARVQVAAARPRPRRGRGRPRIVAQDANDAKVLNAQRLDKVEDQRA